MQENHGQVSEKRDPAIGSERVVLSHLTRSLAEVIRLCSSIAHTATLLKPKKAEVRRTMTQAPNATPEPVDPDAACTPTFESEEVSQYYQEGVLPRSEADVYDVLFATGFAQE
jgi:hypothetical protein